jgi:hypothetical protein
MRRVRGQPRTEGAKMVTKISPGLVKQIEACKNCEFNLCDVHAVQADSDQPTLFEFDEWHFDFDVKEWKTLYGIVYEALVRRGGGAHEPDIETMLKLHQKLEDIIVVINSGARLTITHIPF